MTTKRTNTLEPVPPCNEALNITSITDDVKVVIVVHCDKRTGHQGQHGTGGKLSWKRQP